MATEQELRKEIERLTSRVQELETQEVEIQEVRSSGSVITQARPRAKPDVFSATETSFNDWLNHFELCARINGWSNEQACQHSAVSSLFERASTESVHNTSTRGTGILPEPCHCTPTQFGTTTATRYP